MQVVRTGSQLDPTLLSQAMMYGYREAQQEQQQKEQAKALISRLLLEEEMRRQREEEATKRKLGEEATKYTGEALLKGWEPEPKLEEGPEAGLYPHPYGLEYGYLRKPTMPPTPEGFVGLPTGEPGRVTWKEKPKTKEEAAFIKRMGATPSNLEKWMMARDMLSPGDPKRKIYDQAITKAITQSGMVAEMTPEGGFTFRTNVPAGQMMTKTTQTEVQKELLKTSAGLDRLEQISASYRPEFLELGTKWGAYATKWKEKLKGTPVEKLMNLGVSEREQQLLASFSAFRRDAIDNINRYIKEITGAQMSEAEAKRLRKAMPDPGEGFFDGDSPTEFQAKWKSAMKALRLSQARYLYLMKNGLTPESIKKMAETDTLPSLERIKSIMAQRDAEIEKQIRATNPNLNDADVNQLVLQQLRKEFGVLR